MEEITRNDKVAVGVTSLTVAERFPDRQVILIRNTSTGLQRITVVFGFRSAVDYEGIVLKPGESVTDSDSEGYKSWKGIITAISNIAAGQLSVYER